MENDTFLLANQQNLPLKAIPNSSLGAS